MSDATGEGPRGRAALRAQDRLDEAQEEDRRARLGPSLDWTDDELDDLAAIGPADVADAVAAWKRDAPQALRGLIDAEPAGEQS